MWIEEHASLSQTHIQLNYRKTFLLAYESLFLIKFAWHSKNAKHFQTEKGEKKVKKNNENCVPCTRLSITLAEHVRRMCARSTWVCVCVCAEAELALLELALGIKFLSIEASQPLTSARKKHTEISATIVGIFDCTCLMCVRIAKNAEKSSSFQEWKLCKSFRAVLPSACIFAQCTCTHIIEFIKCIDAKSKRCTHVPPHTETPIGAEVLITTIELIISNRRRVLCHSNITQTAFVSI